MITITKLPGSEYPWHYALHIQNLDRDTFRDLVAALKKSLPHRPSAVTASRSLHLLPTAPQCVMQAAYRAVAKQLNPDAGGDNDTMQHLNEAMELLR
jgi:hypothetical protein